MGAEKAAGQVFDLCRIEDIFACLETISLARSALFSVHPELAGRLAQVSDGLGALAQLLMEEGPTGLSKAEKAPPPAWETRADHKGGRVEGLAEIAPPRNAPYHQRAVSVARTRQAEVKTEGSQGIVDILTGEKIK